MKLEGRSLIGAGLGGVDTETFTALSPATGEALVPDYYTASNAEIYRAVELAYAASDVMRNATGARRALLLEAIASGIEAQGHELSNRVSAETALPTMRVQAETARTCNQLRLFANLSREGSWVDARIDPGQPPAKPDIRSLRRPLGPVAVFGPSNFPLAFSVAGGDTAAALAAGNPVVVMAHYAHPGTSEIVGKVIRDAVADQALPEGVFSLLFGRDYRVGQALVTHPQIQAVAFTGSRAGGEALRQLIASRRQPIPYYAEMSSINPIFLLPGAAQSRAEALAAGLHASVTLGTGQFCTNPGVVFIPAGDTGDGFVELLTRAMEATPDASMLTPGICSSYGDGVAARADHEQVVTLVRQSRQTGSALFRTDLASWLHDTSLATELFGPSTLLVTYEREAELTDAAAALEGQLTATVHGDDDDLARNGVLIDTLTTRAGRVIINGFPTGVEVCSAMVHGGPYPATSDGQSTSVGTGAIVRFARPVCFQDAPAGLLPPALQDDNPDGLWRTVNGQLTRDPVSIG